MNIAQWFKQIPLIKKVMIVAAIPSISYLATSMLRVQTGMQKLAQGQVMMANSAFYESLSSLISSLQQERSSMMESALIPSAPPPSNDQFLKTNRLLQDVIQKVDKASLTEESLKNALPKMKNNLTELRTSWKDEDPQIISMSYSYMILSLILLQKDAITHYSSDILMKMRTLVMIEDAKENSAQLSYLAGKFLKEDLPLETESFKELIKLKGTSSNTLSSDLLDISILGQENLKSLKETGHWQKSEQIFNTIIEQFNDGGYGYSAKEYFDVQNQVLRDLSELMESEYILAKTRSEDTYEENRSTVITHLTAILFNTILIIAILWAAAKTMKSDLGQILSEVHRSSESVLKVSNGLSDSSKNMTTGSQRTASAVQETMSSMTQMGSTAQSTFQKAEQSKSASQNVADLLVDSQEVVNELLESMNAINESKNQLEQLDRVISSIEKQTKLIDDIVFKTQLLSVNASIESAKAGEAGRGFSVVAEEVSKLAQSSGLASEKISEMIEQSHTSVEDVVKDINSKISLGMQNAKNVHSMFKKINQEISEISSHAEDVKQASDEQRVGISHVTTAITEIDLSTQNSTKEAIEIENQSIKLSEECQSLEHVSSSLQELVLGRKKNKKVEPRESNNTPPGTMGDIQPTVSKITTSTAQVDFDADDDSFKPAS